MDPRSFDALTRRMTRELPRRKTIALLAGAVSSLLPGEVRTVEAGCTKVGKKCNKNKDCCDGAKCKKETCKCKSGRTECGGKCHKLDKDKKHCGVCNNQCSGPELCLSAVCIDPAK
jgi:hypothetical protein